MILRSAKSFVKSTELIRGHGSVITKEYMEDTKVFADVFNHMTYQGEKVNVCKGILGIEEKGRAAGREEGRIAGREEGRAEGMSAGIQREQKLTRSLRKDNRIEDLKRALDDPAFRQKLCEEYGID